MGIRRRELCNGRAKRTLTLIAARGPHARNKNFENLRMYRYMIFYQP